MFLYNFCHQYAYKVLFKISGRPFKVLKGKLERLPLVQRFRKRKAELYEYLAECLEQYWFYLQMEVRGKKVIDV